MLPKPSKIVCKNFAKYKGKRRPKCRCLVCRDIYIDNLERKLRKISSIVKKVKKNKNINLVFGKKDLDLLRKIK